MSRDELLLLCIGDVIAELVQAHQDGRDVNLNKTKTRIASKYGLETSPRLVDIIAAVPSQYKKVENINKIWISNFSSSSGVGPQVTSQASANCQWYSSGGGHVQTSQMSSYKLHW